MSSEAVARTQFSNYPQEMDLYLKNKKAVIKILPEKYSCLTEKKCCDIQITSAQQLVDLLKQEKDYWKEQKSKGTDYLNCFDKVSNALTNFETAKDCFVKNDNYNKERYINNAISQVGQGYLYSQTDLAKYISKLSNKGSSFFQGFDLALQNKDNLQFGYSICSGSFEGYYEGLIYRGEVKQVRELYGKCASDFADNVKIANDNFSKLNNEYTIAYHEQEHRIAEIQQKTNDEIKNLKDESEKYLSEKKQKFNELENLYAEKLKLEKPAEYWKKMSESYQKQGIGWLIGSVALALAIIGILITIIICAPNAFGEDTHIFDIVKNSAIITVIASVAIYLLRTFIKMAMSSLHLSRDAKEREQLSYFYLALIANGAVSEKEQALVINALFSRSDTGLLKGDSTPSMTANVGEIVDKLTTK